MGYAVTGSAGHLGRVGCPMRAFFLSFALLASGASAAIAGPAYKLDAKRDRVLDVSGLEDGSECVRAPRPLVGRIVRRSFDREGVLLAGVVVEDQSGQRTALNVMVADRDLSMVDRGSIVSGLQGLSKVGSPVRVLYTLCGAAGHVMMIDAIRRN